MKEHPIIFSGPMNSSTTESMCSCGQPVLIEHNSIRTCRTDGKRIYYPDETDRGFCAFLCKQCHGIVSETVPGAEY